MQVVFSDDFQLDSRTKYSMVSSAVGWERGALVLGPGAKISRDVEAGPTAEVEIALDFPPLSEDGEFSETKVALLVRWGKQATVVLRRQRDSGKVSASGKITATQLQLFSNTVQDFSLPDGPLGGRWRVRYRYGLVQVEREGAELAIGYIENDNSSVSGVLLNQVGARITCASLRVLTPVAPARTTLGSKELAETKEQERELVSRLSREPRLPNALPLAKQLLPVVQKLYGADHPYMVGALFTLVDLSDVAGDYVAARRYHEQCLEIVREVYGDLHPSTASVLNKLAVRLKALGDYPVGLRYAEEAVAITRKVLGEKHVNTANTLNTLASLELVRGEYDRAGPHLQQAMEICKVALGENHSNYGITLNNLGEYYMLVGDYTRAEPLLRQANKLFEQAPGEQHPELAYTLRSLGLLYRHVGDEERAEPLLLRAVNIARQTMGEKHLYNADRRTFASG
jgi:tetratricopeptide (TPR) repeat protein